MAEENKKLHFNADTGKWENLPDGYSIVNEQTYKVGDKYVAALDTDVSKGSTILLVQDKGSAYYTVTSRPKDADFGNNRDIASAYFDENANHTLLFERTMGNYMKQLPVYVQSVFSKGMASMGIQPCFTDIAQAQIYAMDFKEAVRNEEKILRRHGYQIVPYDNHDYSVPMALKLVKHNDTENPTYLVPIFTSFDYDMDKVVKSLQKEYPNQYDTIVGDGVKFLKSAYFGSEEKMKEFCWKIHFHSMNKGDFSKDYAKYLSFLSKPDIDEGVKLFTSADNPYKTSFETKTDKDIIMEGKETTMKEQEKKYSLPEDMEPVMAHEPAAAVLQGGIYTPEAVVERIKARIKASMKVANVPLSTLTVSFASKMRDIYAKAKHAVSAQDLSAEFSCKYLLDNALTHAAKHDGLWLNTKGNTYPTTMPYKNEFTHYGAVLAALYSEKQGYPTNVFCGMEGLNKMKVLVKEKEIPHPLEVPMLGIDGTQMKMLYNIEQTTMEKDSPRQYARYNAKYSAKAKPDELYIHKSYESYEKQKEDPTISMFRIGDKYMLFGKHASIVSNALGREGVFNREIGELTLTIPVKDMESAIATLSSSNRKIALYDAKALYRNDPPSKLYDTFLPFVKDRGEKFGVKVEPCHHARSYYDSEKNTLYLRGADKATTPTKEMDKEKEASSILHALADMAQQRIGRQALGLDNLKPEDAKKYSALLSEIAVGSQLLLRNIPARISEENMFLIPYWKQQIRENPDMKKIIENGVNYIHDMMTDMNIRRYSRDLNITGVVEKNPALLTITEDLGGYPDIKSKSAVIIRDKNKNYADVLLPSGASPVALEEISGMEKDTFIAALAKEGIREVNFFNIHGYCAMRYPNLYYDKKQIEIVTVRDGKIVPRAQVDVKDEIRRTAGVQIETMGLLKNFNGRLEMYIVPKEGKPVSIEPTYNDIQEYFNAVKMTDKEAAMDKKKSLGVKYYNKALENPELQTDLLAPKTEGIDSDRIKNINLVKNEDGTSEIHVKIDNEHYKKPLTFDQYQRLWLVIDKEAYKLALTSVLFEKELGRKETQDEGIDRESLDIEEKKPVPVEIQDDTIDGQDNTTEPDIEQDDKKEIRRGGRGR